MKINIKIIIMSIFLAFTIAIPLSAFADSNSVDLAKETNILTYQKAVELAIKESNELKKIKLDKESTTVKIDDTLEQFGTNLYDPQVLALIKLQKNDKINSEKSAKMEEYIKQALAFKLKSMFNNINLMEQDLDLKMAKLNNDIQKRNTIALKFEYGMESKTNLTTKDIEINQIRKDIETLEKEIQEQYISLSKIIGYDRFTKYNIEKLNFEYKPINDTQEDIEFKASRALSSDISVWGIKQQLEIQRIDVDFYALNYISGLPSNMQAKTTPYRALELDAQILSNDVEQAKKDLRDSVINKYNSIKKIETAYDNTVLKRKELEEKKRILEVAIKTGTAINQDYKDLLLGINEVNNGIEKIQSQHALLVEMYNSPLLVGGSIN